jgi:hypothetical protein
MVYCNHNFPLFYQADVLFTLRALADVGQLGAKPAFRKAVDWLVDRCAGDGRWNGASPCKQLYVDVT